MINCITLLLFMGLAFWGCKDSYEDDDGFFVCGMMGRFNV